MKLQFTLVKQEEGYWTQFPKDRSAFRDQLRTDWQLYRDEDTEADERSLTCAQDCCDSDCGSDCDDEDHDHDNGADIENDDNSASPADDAEDMDDAEDDPGQRDCNDDAHLDEDHHDHHDHSTEMISSDAVDGNVAQSVEAKSAVK